MKLYVGVETGEVVIFYEVNNTPNGMEVLTGHIDIDGTVHTYRDSLSYFNKYFTEVKV
jgi:hypothetical protein